MKGYRNQRAESVDLKEQLNIVKTQTCYDKFQELDEIKEEHRLALEAVEELYRARGTAQFQARRGSWEASAVTAVYKQITDQEDQLSWLEMRSWEVRQSIAGCNQ